MRSKRRRYMPWSEIVEIVVKWRIRAGKLPEGLKAEAIAEALDAVNQACFSGDNAPVAACEALEAFEDREIDRLRWLSLECAAI